MNLILLTFIFSYLMNRLIEFTAKRIPVNRKLLVLFMYTVIVGVLAYGLVKYLPILTLEISQLIKQVNAFYTQPHDNTVIKYIEAVISKNQIVSYLENGFSFLIKSFTDISKISIHVMIALVLSLFFLLEKPRLQEFTAKFKSSKLAPFYFELEFFGKKFTRTFGKVIEVQFMIALVNCFLTMVALVILDFPQLFVLALMVFFWDSFRLRV